MKNLLHNSKKRKISIIFIIIAIFFLIGVFGILWPLKKIYSSSIESVNEAKAAWYLIKTQDIVNAAEKLKATHEKIIITQKNLQLLSWSRFFPFFGNYYRDADRLIKAGLNGLEAGQIMVEAIEPYADILGLKGQGSFVGGSAEERIVKTVQTIDKIVPKLDEVEEKLIIVKTEIEAINPHRYPLSFRGIEIKNNIINLKNSIEQAENLLSQTKPLIKVLPEILGEPEMRRYLILWQNDKELRPTGGFITAYSLFRLEHGKIFAEHSEDIYNLDQRLTRRFPAPDPILKYHKNVYQLHLRDSNLSPDFYESMRKFEEMYQYVSGKSKIDGIIAIDTNVLINIMNILGPIQAYGTTFTTETVKACNCPMILYELEKYADKPVNYERGSRKDIIGVLLYQIMQKALGAPKQWWQPLFQTGLDMVKQKHILIYLHDENEQKAIESFGAAGRIISYHADYLHINDSNFAGAKSNMFINQSVEQKIEKENDGTLIKTLTINYKNPYPASDCGLESGGLCLNGLYRDWVRVYVPQGSELLESQGSEIKIQSYEDIGKTVFEAFYGNISPLRPLGTAKLIFKYKLPFKIDKEYKLLIQKQPGTKGHEYTIIINGKGIDKFVLETDKELKYKTELF